MNPESLANYKLQVYNPGSPYPSPKADSFKAFPTVSIANPENPLKLTFSNRKRCRNVDPDDLESTEDSSKKLKMMKEEEVKALFKELRDETKNDMESFKKDFAKTFAEEQTKANAQTNTPPRYRRWHPPRHPEDHELSDMTDAYLLLIEKK